MAGKVRKLRGCRRGSDTKLACVLRAHCPKAFVDVPVDIWGEAALEEGQELLAKVSPACHPLVVAAATVVVGPVKASAGKASLDPAEQGIVPLVHPQRDMRLTPVTTEVALTHEDAYQHTLFEVTRHRGPPPLADPGHCGAQNMAPDHCLRLCDLYLGSCVSPSGYTWNFVHLGHSLFHRQVTRGTPRGEIGVASGFT